MGNIYNGINYPHSSFVFDKIYRNYIEAQSNVATDNILLGRYVLIAYCDVAFSQNARKEIEVADLNTWEQGTPEYEYWNNFQKDNKHSYDRIVLRKIWKDDKFTYEQVTNLSVDIETKVLETVDYNSETNTLTLTWNTVGGKEVVDIDLTDLIDVYTAWEEF